MNDPIVPNSASSIELASRLRSFHEQNIKYLEGEITSLEYALKQYLPDWTYEQTELVKEFLSKTEKYNNLIKEQLFLTAYLKALETRQDLTEEKIQQIRIDISLEIEEQASQRIKENFDTPELHEVSEMQKSIKPLYRNISKLIHPDLAQDENQISLREKAFQTLSDAYFSEDPSAVAMIPSKYLKTALITLIGLTKAYIITITKTESTTITETLQSIEAKDYNPEAMTKITSGLQLLSQSTNLNLVKG